MRSNLPAPASVAATRLSPFGGRCRGSRWTATIRPVVHATTTATASPMPSRTPPRRARPSSSTHGRRASACEDNSLRDRGSTVVNARAGWKGKKVEIYGEVLNVFDSGGQGHRLLLRILHPLVRRKRAGRWASQPRNRATNREGRHPLYVLSATACRGGTLRRNYCIGGEAALGAHVTWPRMTRRSVPLRWAERPANTHQG